jgi:hypothetical protein
MSAVERDLGLTCSVSFSDGWQGVERQGALWWRWNNGNGTVRILSNVAGAGAMRGWLTAASPPAKVDVLVNGVRRSPAGGFTVDEGKVALDMALPLSPGETKVEFAGREPAVPLGRDTRAIGVGNLEVLPMEGAPACVGLGVAAQ